MPKTKISEYSTTNSSNTDIEGINIDEGCAPSGINNAIRELMVHLKEFQTGASGDAFTFAGGVLISGTANTITGNVLMSGTNTITGSTTATFAAGAVGTPSIAAHGDTNTGIFFPAADTIAFAEGGAEAMRIDSSGNLGIGTSSPTQKLHVQSTTNAQGLFKTTGAGGGSNRSSVILESPSNTWYINTNGSDINGSDASLGFYGNNATRMVIDSSGNVGIGVTPSATSSGTTSLEVKAAGSGFVSFGSVDTVVTSGAYYSSTGWRYAVSSLPVSTYYQQEGIHKWFTAASGTAGNAVTLTERARITSGGSFLMTKNNAIGINTSDGSDDGYLALCGAGADGSARGGHIYLSGNERTGSTGTVAIAAGNVSGGFIEFRTGADVERARITSGGYFKASNNGSYVSSTGPYHEFNNNDNNECLVSNATNASYSSDVISVSATRSANSAYDLLAAFSGNFGDLEFRLRGDGNGYADGTWNNNGADYAEFFESANGQALTLGATVVLDGNKVREATSQDPASAIIGVVRPKEPSKASMVVGNTAWNKWANKYLTDDFDRYIMEDHDVVEWEEQVLEREAVAAVEAVVDEKGNEVSPAVPAQEAVYKTKQHSYESHNIPAGVIVPADAVRKTHDDKGNKFQHYKLNPAWDKDAEYVNRENRPEWNIIGLLGQVKILKGQPVGDRWIKMRDVSATVEEWMIR